MRTERTEINKNNIFIHCFFVPYEKACRVCSCSFYFPTTHTSVHCVALFSMVHLGISNRRIEFHIELNIYTN